MRPVLLLVLATAGWGLSFPVAKAAGLAQEALLPGYATWFHSAVQLFLRFGIAAGLLAIWQCTRLHRFTRLEWQQGASLGGFAAAGCLLQVDGLAYTHASTSAFLTQFTCVLVPIWAAWEHRRFPGTRVITSVLIVLAGVALLARFDWRTLELGRGELETLGCAVFFTGQIFVLERPRFYANNSGRVSLVMFATAAALLLPICLAGARHPADVFAPLESGPVLALLALLVVICTLGSYLLMNHWQPRVTPTHAGLIYCCEPLFASVLAVFLPGMFAVLAGVAYANESPGWELLAGGTLITLANLLMVLPRRHANQG